MPSPPALILERTLLSRKPRRSAAHAAGLSLALILFASTLYWKNFMGLSPWLAGVPSKVFGQHQYWRLFTGMMIHSDLDHYLSNALPLGLLSYLLFGYFGAATFPIAAIAVGAVTNALSLMTYAPDAVLVGASGAVYAMAGFWLVLYLLVDRRFSVAHRALRTAGFALAMLVPSSYHPEVSYRTHAIGFGLGLLWGGLYFLRHRRQIRRAERWIVDEDSLIP